MHIMHAPGTEQLEQESEYKPIIQRKSKILWKRPFSLPTEPVWYASNLFFIYLTTGYTLSSSVGGKCEVAQSGKIAELFSTIEAVYAVDVIISIACIYIPNLSLPEWNPTYRPIYILVVEVLTLIPIPYFLRYAKKENVQIFCIVDLIKCLRFLRVFYFVHRYSGRMSFTYSFNMCISITSVIMLSLVTYCVYCNVICWDLPIAECEAGCPFLESIVRISKKVWNLGMRTGHDSIHDVNWLLLIGTAQYASFMFVLTPGLAHLVMGINDANFFGIGYSFMYKTLRRTCLNYKVSQVLIDKIHDFFKLGWRSRGGLDKSVEFIHMMSPATFTEMMVDVCWPAFSHSKIFRTMDLCYLRVLAKLMTQEFVLAGDYIYRKGSWKDKMMYLVNGTIEILSEEDGESAIIALGSGTCIGESCVLVSAPSINCVRAKTFCEFHVLSKKAFILSNRSFPQKYNAVAAVIQKRYESAKKIQEVSLIMKKRAMSKKREIDTTTIFWLKNTLHRLMSVNVDRSYRHEFQNIYLLDEVDKSKFDKLIFTASCLDMLAIKERVETDSDPVFVRIKFPVILQPHSVVTGVWELLIVLATAVICILVPYASFMTKKQIPFFLVTVHGIHWLFFLDIFVQCSIAIKSRKEQYVTMTTILIARLQTVQFWVDILSSMPFEIFTPIFITEIKPHKCAMMYFNRTIKIWRIANLFYQWTHQFNINVMLVYCIQMFLVQCYLCYILFCVMCYMTGDTNAENIFDIVQLVTNVGNFQAKMDILTFYLVVQILLVTLRWILLARIIVLYLVPRLHRLNVQFTSSRLINMVKRKKLDPIYLRRLKACLECDWSVNYSFNPNKQPGFMSHMYQMNNNDVIKAVFANMIKKAEFFSELPKDSYSDLLKIITCDTRPPNETIMFNGDIYNDIYILFEGSLDALNAKGIAFKFIDTPQPLNLVEVILDMPTMTTCISRTHCRIISIKRKLFMRFLMQYPEMHNVVQKVIKSVDELKKNAIDSFPFGTIKGTSTSFTHLEKKSFRLFGYKLKVDSFDEYDYFLPFDHLYPFEFIRFFLLRVTVFPDGRFLYIWEGIKCCVALVGATIYFINPLSDDKLYYPLFSIVTGFGACDIYFRLHVCYYNADGILVTHPLMTAWHYMCHGLLLDVLAILPVRYNINIADDLTYFIGNTIRLLPLHRYVQYMNALKYSVIKIENKAFIFLYIPLVFIMLNYIGGFLINMQCQHHSIIESPDFIGFHCSPTSFLMNSNFTKPIDKWRAHLYAMYFVSCFFHVGFTGFQVIGAARYGAIIFSFLGQIVSFIIVSKFFSMHQKGKIILAAHQLSMKRFVSFMKSSMVAKGLIKLVKHSYEVKWKICNGEAVQDVMGDFATPLKRDLYYEFYGNQLYQNSIFAHKTEIFYRNIAEYLKYSTIPKGGYLSTINDIEEHTYIVLTGIADILSPDGTKLTTIGEGAMFGNIEKTGRVRVRISIIAMTHIELFSINSMIFHNFLQFFPEIGNDYIKLREIYFHYIPSAKSQQVFESVLTEDELKTGEGIDICKAFNPFSYKMKVWNLILMVFTCYVCILVDMYQFATGDFSPIILIIMYLGDILYVIHILTLDRIAYVNDMGYMVTDLIKIKRRLRKDKLKTWLSIASVCPIDVIILAIDISHSTIAICYGIARLNRTLRLMHMYDYFAEHSNKTSARLELLKYTTIVIWSSLSLVFFALMIIHLSCKQEINIFPHITDCEIITTGTPFEKFFLCCQLTYLAVQILTATSTGAYFPNGAIHILIFITCFVVAQFLRPLIFAQIFVMYNDISVKKRMFKRHLDRLFYFMDREEVSVSLITRVKNHVKLLWMTTAGEMYPELLKEAPLYLRDAVMNDAFGHLIVDNPVFRNCHPDCMRQIIQKFEIIYYFSGDFIQFRDSVDTSMYFIFSGLISVIPDEHNKQDEILKYLRSGDYFGVKQGLHAKVPYKYTYRCNKRAVILRLRLSDWHYLLQFFPASRQQMYKATLHYYGL